MCILRDGACKCQEQRLACERATAFEAVGQFAAFLYEGFWPLCYLALNWEEQSKLAKGFARDSSTSWISSLLSWN